MTTRLCLTGLVLFEGGCAPELAAFPSLLDLDIRATRDRQAQQDVSYYQSRAEAVAAVAEDPSQLAQHDGVTSPSHSKHVSFMLRAAKGASYLGECLVETLLHIYFFILLLGNHT